MEDSLENWISQLEMEEYDDVLNESHHGSFDEQEFLREILEEQPENLSPQRETSAAPAPR
uniref:Uncharacterized protein n=1 Tax=Glycine max TaxID=3847 RepID=A0A0R0ICZ4_SOYBN